MNATAKHLLLTGPPGCGKTTVVLRLVECLRDLRLRGFYTEEVRQDGQRVGFEVVGLAGRRGVLAHVRSPSRLRVGRYGVEPHALDEVIQAELSHLEGGVDAVLIDEVGKMELFCSSFVEVVPRVLDGRVPVVGTVALNGPGLIGQIQARQDVQLIDISPHDRARLPEDLERWLRERIATR